MCVLSCVWLWVCMHGCACVRVQSPSPARPHPRARLRQQHLHPRLGKQADGSGVAIQVPARKALAGGVGGWVGGEGG